VAIGHDLARGTSAFRRANRQETAASPPRPEPNWETPAGDSAADSATDGVAVAVSQEVSDQQHADSLVMT
jgi:single-strand DNA-binding protein